MKFLEVPELLDLCTRYLSGLDLGGRRVYGAVEAYSCKKTRADKSLSKDLKESMAKEYSAAAVSPLGPIGRSSTRDLLCSLIGTLNESFQDYEFSSVRPEHFVREAELRDVVRVMNSTVVDAIDKVRPGFKNRFWADVERAVTLEHCEIYRLQRAEMPGNDDGEFVHLEPINFFFYNKHRKMILFFHAHARSNLHPPPSSQVDDFESDSRPASQLDDMVGGGPAAAAAAAASAAAASSAYGDGDGDGDGDEPPSLSI